MKNLIFLAIFAAFAFSFASCSHGEPEHTHGETEKPATEKPATEKAADAKSGPEYTAHYICPMHCKGSGSEQAGKCPTCGMDYVLNENHKHGGEATGHEGHDHGAEGHEGHDHDSHEGHNH